VLEELLLKTCVFRVLIPSFNRETHLFPFLPFLFFPSLQMIERSGTDAAVFLTVYPTSGFDAVTTDDFTALAKQILDYQQNLNRTVFLRYAPEMQGTWMEYGQQPTAFNTSWHTMYSTVKATAPETIMVWAPNTPQGYPYGQQTAYAALDAVDQALLDTNNNGELDANDDSLAPYYPGDDVVDWIGLSICTSSLPLPSLPTPCSSFPTSQTTRVFLPMFRTPFKPTVTATTP
jgi:hypothetical protein